MDNTKIPVCFRPSNTLTRKLFDSKGKNSQTQVKQHNVCCAVQQETKQPLHKHTAQHRRATSSLSCTSAPKGQRSLFLIISMTEKTDGVKQEWKRSSKSNVNNHWTEAVTYTSYQPPKMQSWDLFPGCSMYAHTFPQVTSQEVTLRGGARSHRGFHP